MAAGEVSETLKMIYHPFVFAVAAGFGLLTLTCLIDIGRAFAAGEFVHYAGYNDSLYHATNRWCGHYRGGLAITTIPALFPYGTVLILSNLVR